MELKLDELPSTWRWRATKAGLTLKMVAQISGCQHANISKWGKGSISPNFSSVLRIEQVLSDHGEASILKL